LHVLKICMRKILILPQLNFDLLFLYGKTRFMAHLQSYGNCFLAKNK